MTEELDREFVKPLPEFDSDIAAAPVGVSDVKEGLGLPTVQIKAAELVDQTFIIVKARAFVSSFAKGETAYFCVCTHVDTGELFSTVLGGQGVVDFLDLYFGSGRVNPLRVTLRKVKGGRFGRYYVLE